MKRIIALLTSLALTALPLCSCAAGAPLETQEPTSSTMRISAVLPHDDLGSYWTIAAAGVLLAAEELPVDAKICLPQLNYNVSQMTDLIRQSTAAQVDALIVQGIEDEEYLDALETARQQGIQIAFIDTDVPAFGRHLYVGTDNYQAGVMMGERLAEISGGQATVGVISGAPGYPNLDLRLQGIEDAVAAYPGIGIARVEYDYYDALTVFEKYHTILRENPEVNALLCLEGTGGQALSPIIAENPGLLEHVIVFDVSDKSLLGLTGGYYDAVVVQQTQEMGRNAVEELFRHSQQGTYSSPTIFTDTVIITTEDLDEDGGYAVL